MALQIPRMCSPSTYYKQGAPIGLAMNMYCRNARRLHSCMHMIDLTCRYFILNFMCNGSTGRAVAASGISHILPGHFRRGGWWACLDSTDWSQRYYLYEGISSRTGHGHKLWYHGLSIFWFSPSVSRNRLKARHKSICKFGNKNSINYNQDVTPICIWTSS